MSPAADSTLVLLADIGGTNARFALARPGGEPERIAASAVAGHTDIDAAIASYLGDQRIGATPGSAAIAIAAPIAGDEVELTNHPWGFSQRRLAEAHGFSSLRVMNDFEAIALSLPHLGDGDREQLGGGQPEPRAPMAVLGPGTGLGVALLIWSGSAWVAVPGEGGHVDFAPGGEGEVEILRALWREFGHASIERVLSGPGLVTLYRAAAARDGTATALGADAEPKDVAAAAAAGDSAARAAAEAFSGLLGAAAGDLALTAGAFGGVFLAGGVVANMGAAFDRQNFRTRFEHKGRFSSYVARIPVWRILHSQPALLGLARTSVE